MNLKNELLIQAFNTITCFDDFYKDFGITEVIVDDDFLEYPEVRFESILSFSELDWKLNELVKEYPFIIYGLPQYDSTVKDAPGLHMFTMTFISHRINGDKLESNEETFKKFKEEIVRRNPTENVMQAIVSPIANYYDWDTDETTEVMEDSAMMCYLTLENDKLQRIYSPRLSAEATFAAETFINRMYNAFMDGPLSDYASEKSYTQIDLRSDLVCWTFDVDIIDAPKDIFRKLKFLTEENIYPCFMETKGFIDTDIEGQYFRARIAPDHVTIEMHFTLYDNMIEAELLEQDPYPLWFEGVDFL